MVKQDRPTKEVHYFHDEEQGCLSVRSEPPPECRNFPTPKSVFIISAPVLVMVDQEDANQSMKNFVDKSFTSHSSKKKLKIKMRSLIIKMVNNLIRQELIAFEAIQVLSSAGNVQVRILVAPQVLSVLLERCERIGVGSVVGQCYACPIETSMLPAIGPPKELVWPTGSGANVTTMSQTKVTTMSLNDQTPDTSKTLPCEDQEGEGDSISSEEEEDEDEEEGEEVFIDSLRTQIPERFLGAGRRKELQRKVAAAREEWRKTASRVRVEQVVEEVAAGAAFSLDYLAFVICASIIAAVGLAVDSSATVIASMLVSPIMGPVLGFTFGTVIRRKSLVLTSFRNEAVSLLICIVVGMFMCVVCARTNTPQESDWPTSEMTSRGDPAGLKAGIWVAIPSGMAVALSTLGKNSSGMTGVAISLSLLPPAVNAGLCWMYELLLLSKWERRNEGDDSVYWQLGTVSFALTLLNILCIWLGGVVMFWMKEVAPINKKNVFWSRDIKAARDKEKLHVDTDKIQEGLEAVIELNECSTGFDVCSEDEGLNSTLTSMQLGAARRKSLANSAAEDAFFLESTNFGLGDDIVGGSGVVCSAVPNERKTRAVANRRAAIRKATVGKSIFDVANQFGGLEGAGEALFDKDDSMAGLIPHEIVAEQILVQDALFDPSKSKSKAH